MYCPTCAAQNIDNAQFCRACGSDIGFLSKALTRRAPEKEQQLAEQGLRYSFIGAGFLVIAIIMLFAGPAEINWALCFAMLCAAFPLLGSGLAKIHSPGNQAVNCHHATRPRSFNQRASQRERLRFSACALITKTDRGLYSGPNFKLNIPPEAPCA